MTRYMGLLWTSLVTGSALLAGCAAMAPNAGETPIAEDLTANQVILIGESHGTAEVPAYIGDLATRLPGRTLVALELREDTRQLDCRTGATPASWQASRDGRGSAAMRDLVCFLRNRKIDTMFIDSRDLQNRTFYAVAAPRIAAALDSRRYDRVVVLTGNYHNQNAPGKLPALLRAAGKRVITATAASPAKGTAWQCTGVSPADCGVKNIDINFCPSPMPASPLWTRAVPPGHRWDACVVFPTQTASPPANPQ